MGDDLDDILSSALDEVSLSEQQQNDESKVDLSNAVKEAAETSAASSKESNEQALKSSTEGTAADGVPGTAGLGGLLSGLGGNGTEGFDDAAAADLLKQLDDPEFAKTLEETLKFMESGNMDELQKSFADGKDPKADAELADNLKSLAEAAKGLEGADAGQAEEMGEKIIQDMMKQFETLGNKEDFTGIMDNMLKQMLSKDVMYTPIKQVTEKYPEWLAENEGKLEEKEYERYGKQYQFYQRICACYETEPDNFSRITELLQNVQEYGQPPVEIMKELAPGLEIGEDGVPKMPGMGGGVPGMPPGIGGAPGMPPGGEMPPECKQQ